MTELPDVARTAIGAARLRAQESERPDRLFDDPYAKAFATGEGPVRELFADHLAFRTRFFDDHLLGAGLSQVVLVAAGLDSRAYRLPWPPGLRLFELDLPELLAYKDGVLARLGAEPRCERVPVPVDLREDWPAALRAAGFDPAVPAAWLAEGLLIYLSAAEAGELLTRIGALAAPGSSLAFEHDAGGAARLMAAARTRPAMGRLAELWKGGLGEDAPAWLAARGWRPRTVGRAELAERYGRRWEGAGGFLTALRQGPAGSPPL
ncbi:SAM-dependent methyltransferase [Actinomadura sp. ATCC 31491]|uniref:S-adenosyl-L-methionine-dependent methyltransferase n=1 Tax=Actinomadura luzonensis TaxID=2805427 RepID=A0ABT0G400_9ACTN|nr:SAM-dependent methyltransferase [Actinomadura luzonensis]MCK2218925.1 SAM-dependent methyltransferase [Actinomadura luzonensis]